LIIKNGHIAKIVLAPYVTKIESFSAETDFLQFPEISGSVFAEAAVYAKMQLLHKEFTETIYSRPIRQNVAASGLRITTAVQLFSPKNQVGKDQKTHTCTYIHTCVNIRLFWGQRPLVPLLLLGPRFFLIILFGSTTLLTGMTGIS
jgi:hypothetical protein